ncbi:MAG: DUF2384 domain-containing protein [Bacteroidales bacterium]|nr:DUF2384 domain-containing protein [Bacteroidales bacterium]
MILKQIFQDEDRLIKASRSGITKKVYNNIMKSTGISMENFTRATRITPRTIQRKKPDELVAPEASERAILIGKLYFMGEKVFANKEKFKTWMTRPNSTLNGKMPKDLLDTITGLGIVQDELLRIEHGILA